MTYFHFFFDVLSVVGLRRYPVRVTIDCDGMGSIPATPEARNVPLLPCHERFNEASLPVLSVKAGI